MRNGQNKRMRGRNRNKGHHGGGGGGGHHHHHNPLTRVYESNGPEVKIRGTAHHIAEKYLQLARDAQTSGDPVTAENHFQHAEHYLRLIAAAQEQFRQQNPFYQAPPPPGEGNRDDQFEGEEDESGQLMPGQQQPMQAQPNFGAPQQPQYQQPPREQPQPQQYQPQPQQYQQPHQQSRPQHQPQQYQPQPQQYQQPQQFQPQVQQPAADVSDGERLPSFITGAQPQQGQPAQRPNGYDNQGGDRFGRNRRRRNRGPRPDVPNGPQEFRSEDGPDDSRPDNV
jgi:hypothetical protein